MKVAQLREMSEIELNQKLADARKELFNLRFQMAAGQLENTHNIKRIRQDIARIITIREEQKLSPEEKQMVKEARSEKKPKKEPEAEIQKSKEKKPAKSPKKIEESKLKSVEKAKKAAKKAEDK